MIIFSLLLALIFASSASAELTLNECKDYGNQLISRLSGVSFTTKQGNYKDQNGNYWQGVSPVTRRPRDGEKLRVNKNKKPAGHGKSWKKFGAEIDAEMPVELQIHEYVGPLGPGYVLIVSFEYGSQLWVKAKNFGPETFRTHDWSAK